MTNSLWNQLQNAGLVQGEMPASTIIREPFFSRFLSICGAWLGIFFSLSFSFSMLYFLLEAPVLLALLYVIPAFYFARVDAQQSIFIQHFTLACYALSQTFLGLACHQLWADTATIAWCLIAVNLLMLLWLKQTLLRQMIIYWVVICFIATLDDSYTPFILPTLLACAGALWLNLFQFPRCYSWFAPLTQTCTVFYLLGCLLMYSDLSSLYVLEKNSLFNANIAVSIISFGLASCWVWRDKLPKILCLWVVIVSVLNYWIAGIAGILLLLALTLRLGHKSWVIALLCSLIALLFMYYYSLHLTLLYKSIVLMLSGLGMLATFAILQRQFSYKNSQEIRHE